MSTRVLLVEGNDDEHVVKHLCRAHEIEVNFQIDKVQQEGGGVEYLISQVPVRLKASDIERLAVLVDADDNVQSRWQQLRDRLVRAGYTEIPANPSPEGTIVDIDDGFRAVRLGIWLMPDNTVPGILENFLAFLVPDDDKMMPYVDRFLDGIPPGDRLFPDVALPKARIHTYLAIQREPGKPVGLAISLRYLNADHEVVMPFVNWLRAVLAN